MREFYLEALELYIRQEQYVQARQAQS
jgi:hypothetical protein